MTELATSTPASATVFVGVMSGIILICAAVSAFFFRKGGIYNKGDWDDRDIQ